MSREFAVVYDRAREAILGASARAVARELGCSAEYTDELIFLSDREIDFRKCVFFDADVITGLRLETLNVRLCNNVGSAELCADLRRVFRMLEGDGIVPSWIPSPATALEDKEFLRAYAAQTAERLGLPLIAIPAQTGWRSKATRIDTLEDLISLCAENAYVFLQGDLDLSKTYSLYVVDGDVKGTVTFAKDGTATQITPPYGMESTAVDACALLGLDFGCVTMIEGRNQKPLVLDVNACAPFEAFNDACGICIEKAIAETVRKENNMISDFPGFGF